MSSQRYTGNNGYDGGRWTHQNQVQQDFENMPYDQDHSNSECQTGEFQGSNIDPNLLRQNASSPISPVQNPPFGHAFSTGPLYSHQPTGIDVNEQQDWEPETVIFDPAAGPAIDNWLSQNFGGADQGPSGYVPMQQSAPISAGPMLSQYTMPYDSSRYAAPTAEMANSYGPYPGTHTAAPPRLDSPPARPSSNRPNKRRRQTSPRQASYQANQHQCPGFSDHKTGNVKRCGTLVKKSQDPDGILCSKCYKSLPRVNATAKQYTTDQRVDIVQAWDTLYPRMAGLNHPDDDVHTESLRVDDYIRALAVAVSTEYVSDGTTSKGNSQRLRQQVKMDRKPFDSFQYENDLVNKRLLLLFYTAVSYHAGGRSFYDIGGDNYGYGEEKNLIFSARLSEIIKMLTTDKDIAMDVIEGRGVTALVKNPDKYQRRKRDNKKSNDTKADLQEKGKQVLEAEQMRMSASVEAGPSGVLDGFDFDQAS